jgi:cephalosporin-C deacetylase-like acetyl esterase
MIEPEDYGLGPEETLARVGDPTRASLHKAFWTRHWTALTESHRPILTRKTDPDPSDPSATHWFPGLRHADIGCRLVMPEHPPRGVVILLHGYDAVPSLAEQTDSESALLKNGLALLAIRVRGFAGSRTGSLPPAGQPGSGWVTCGLDAPENSLAGAEAWVVPLAVADVIDAARAARNWLIDEKLADAMIAIKGESLGATLAIDAVAALNGRLPRETIVDRLVIALPTLADWPWRTTHPAPTTGTGAEIDALLKRTPEPAHQAIIERLRLIDPVVHAPHVRIPVLCKLAQRDDVAPAPAAAAAFNALSSDPGRRWRFVVPFGHFDGGIANARRHALFERCAADFLDPAVRPRQSMRSWLDRLHIPPDSSEATP